MPFPLAGMASGVLFACVGGGLGLCFSGMQSPPGQPKRSFTARTNDLACRDWTARLTRFVRSELRRWCAAGLMLADDPRVLRAWRRKWDTSHYIQLLRWHDDGFRPGVVYDIGAHAGAWSEMCQAIFEPNKCLLFEPQRELREKAMTRQPPPPGCWQMAPVALGDHQETQSLHLTRNLAASSLLAPLASDCAVLTSMETVGEEKVEVVPLDVLVAAKGLPKPDFVKIDVQGFEGRVLAGGKDTLTRTRRMVIEVSLHPLYDGQSLMPEVLQTLSGWGFELDNVQESYRQWPGPLRQVDLWLKKN